jgi:hypothetical protein
MLLMHFLIPAARAQLAQRQAEIAENVTAGLLQDGVFQHPAEGITSSSPRSRPRGRCAASICPTRAARRSGSTTPRAPR